MCRNQNFLKAVVSATGVGIILQILYFARYLLIAAYFGISRELDIFFMTDTIAQLVVFSFSVIFENVGVPHLVKSLESEGYNSFKRLTGSIFTFSLILTFFLSIFFVISSPIFAKFMAAGFSIKEKKAISLMAFYFVPWALVCLPYYALCSFYKSIRHFNFVFLADILVGIFSIVCLIFYHSNSRALPFSYFVGYFLAFLVLLLFSFKYFDRIGNIFTVEMKKIYKNFIELFGINQINSITSIVERFLQSYLVSGGISVLTYSANITAGINGILSFRDIFIVPLSSTKQRKEKLERVIIALIVIIIPIALFTSYYAQEIITILFKRGKFDSNAVRLTASVLSIYALSLIPAITLAPILRIFLIIDRLINTAIISILGILNFLLFGWIFIFHFKLGTEGIALMIVVNGYISFILSFFLLKRGGIKLNFIRIIKYAVYSLLVGFLCVNLVTRIYITSNFILEFLIEGFIYLTAIGIGYLPIRQKLLRIVYVKDEQQ